MGGVVTGQASRVRPLRRPDESMSLLNDLFAKPLEPGYEEAAARRPKGEKPKGKGLAWSPALVLGLVALGLLLTMAVVQVRNTASVVSSERQGLIEQIHSEDDRVSGLQGDVTALEAEIGELEDALLQNSATGQQMREEVESLQALTGAIAVTGPGVVVTVDNAEDYQTADDPARLRRVGDLDLQQVVNGLWAAGAEAVSINGQRITPLTAIRSAQQIIQINYRPMNAPYEVTAIGDSRTLGSDFADSVGGGWLSNIAANNGIRFDVSSEDSLTLPAGNVPLSYATPGEDAS